MLSLSSCRRQILISSKKQHTASVNLFRSNNNKLRIDNNSNSNNRIQTRLYSYIHTPYKDDVQSEKHKSNALFATGLGAAVNFGLAVSKGSVGYAIGSTALLADCFNSMGDLVADAVVYFSVTEARKKATPDKPWGSGKIEPLGAFVVGTALAATGAGIACSACVTVYDMYYAVEAVSSSIASVSDLASLQTPQLAALSVAGISVFLKEGLFHYTLKAGQKANSDAIIANAWQHRSDVFVSISVFCGLTGSFAGLPMLDPLAGLLVSGVILKQAATICTKAYRDLSDAPATEEETQALRKTCLLVPGIKSVVDLKARRSGPYIYVECTVGVRGDVSASTAHRLGELVRTELLRRHKGRVANAVVDIDPLGSTGLGELASSGSRSHEAITHMVKKVLLEPQRRPLTRPVEIPDGHPNPDVFQGRPVSKSKPKPVSSLNENAEDRNFNNIRHILSVSEVIVYYKDDGSLSLKVDVCMNPDLTIRQAHKIACKYSIAFNSINRFLSLYLDLYYLLYIVC
jgi:cation diffusion facilitator family transporter